MGWTDEGHARITWSDEHVSTYEPAHLRRICPCADCRGTHGAPPKAFNILTPKQLKLFEEKKEIDFGFGVPGLGRFRANLCMQRGTIAMVFRLVPMEIPSLESLMLPPLIRDIALKPRGLVLVTGITGSGMAPLGMARSGNG